MYLWKWVIGAWWYEDRDLFEVWHMVKVKAFITLESGSYMSWFVTITGIEIDIFNTDLISLLDICFPYKLNYNVCASCNSNLSDGKTDFLWLNCHIDVMMQAKNAVWVMEVLFISC